MINSVFKRVIPCLLITCLLIPPWLSGCQEQEPIRLGFLGDLSSRSAGLGTAGRDGFQLAIEEVNASGGINGRLVTGMVRDSRLDQETAIRAVRDLVDNNVVTIIGPMTSQVAMAVVPEINRSQVPMISPTVSTNQLIGRDDFFFRVYYSNAQAAALLADRLATREEISRIAIVYDLGNRAYTEDWVRIFRKNYESRNGKVVVTVPFEVRSGTLFTDLARQALDVEPQGVLVLANAVDTALLCQQIAKQGVRLPLFGTGWSYSDDLIQFGGQAVEGLTLVKSANMNAQTPSFNRFRDAYLKRYHQEPNFPALHAYDATRFVIAALGQTNDPPTIRKILGEFDHFNGTQGDLAFDRFGDQKNPQIFLGRIQDGRFVLID